MQTQKKIILKSHLFCSQKEMDSNRDGFLNKIEMESLILLKMREKQKKKANKRKPGTALIKSKLAVMIAKCRGDKKTETCV